MVTNQMFLSNSDFENTLKKIQQEKINKTRRIVMLLAHTYTRMGLTQSESLKKAWAVIKADQAAARIAEENRKEQAVKLQGLFARTNINYL